MTGGSAAASRPVARRQAPRRRRFSGPAPMAASGGSPHAQGSWRIRPRDEIREAFLDRLQGRFGVRDQVRLDPDLDDDLVADLPLGEGAVVQDIEDVEGHRREAERPEDPASRGLDRPRGVDDLVDELLHTLCWATTLRRGLFISLAGVMVVLRHGMDPRNQARQNKSGVSGLLWSRWSKVSTSPIGWWGR